MRYCFGRLALWCLLALVAATAVEAARFTIPRNICIEEIIDFGPPPIPVGCEIVDCCPGCPGPVFDLDWRIRFDSDVFESTVVTFDNLDPEIAANLEIEGDAEWIGENQLMIGRGETLLRGFRGDQTSQPAVGRFETMPMKSRAASRPGLTLKAGESAGMSLVVDQFVGPTRVGEFQTEYRLIDCPPPMLPGVSTSDDIDLSPDTGDEAVVLMDGRRPGIFSTARCVNDEVFRVEDEAAVGSFLSRDICNEEIVIFSDDNEMLLIEQPGWRDPLGDNRWIQMHDRLSPKVEVWLVDGSVWAKLRAEADLARADHAFNSSNCGIGFRGQIHNAPEETEGLLDGGCELLGDLRQRIGYEADRINVYYLRNAGATALRCSDNVILVGSNASNETLAHMFGHLFSLEDTNAHPSIPFTNIMNDTQTYRDTFTEGQCFRANVNSCAAADSYLNSSGFRASRFGRWPPPTRCCPDGTISSICPALELDILPN